MPKTLRIWKSALNPNSPHGARSTRRRRFPALFSTRFGLVVLAFNALFLVGCSIVIEAPTPDSNSAANPRAAEAAYQKPMSLFAGAPETSRSETASSQDAHHHPEKAPPTSTASDRDEGREDRDEGREDHDDGHADHSPTATAEPPTEALGYTCSMHREVHQHEPGKCPKCGMTLVAREQPPEGGP